MSSRLFATPQALEAIERLKARHGAIVIHQSGGCCDGSSPICLPAGELPPGPSDVLLGDLAGTPVYIDAAHDRVGTQLAFFEAQVRALGVALRADGDVLTGGH